MALHVITEYYAQEGQEERVAQLLTGHWQLLHQEGFTTDQPSFLMRDGEEPRLLVEVFAWKDKSGPDKAWDNPQISELWNEIQSLCEGDIEPDYYEPLAAMYIGGG